MSSRAFIALLTDYGLQDSYAGILKAVILSKAPETAVIDLTHGIQPQNVRQASECLLISYRYFPKGTLFVCVVDPGVGTSRKILAARTADYYFLAPDNGLLSGVLNKEKCQLRELKVRAGKISNTFHGRDIFAPAAAKWANASNKKSFMNSLGPAAARPVLLDLNPRKTKKGIRGEIIYFDHFGNAITNISSADIPAKHWKGLHLRAGNVRIEGISKTYGTSPKPLALWSSGNRLEIAVPSGSAQSLLKKNLEVEIIYG